ncbi:Multi-heme protein MamP [Gammaproteobacteria bacterium]
MKLKFLPQDVEKFGYVITAIGFFVFCGVVLTALFSQSSVENVPVAKTLASGASALPVAVVGRAPRKIRDPAPLKAYVAPNIRLAEAHWQGLEALPLTADLKKKLRLPETLDGLLIDEVTLNAATSGLLAGDVLGAVDGTAVSSLEALVQASKRVQNKTSTMLTVYRKGQWFSLTMSAPDNLGFVQAETAPMILPGEITPHSYRGPCTQCHAIGTTGHIVPDPDGIILPPPPISAKTTTAPHQERGPCAACHQIIQ